MKKNRTLLLMLIIFLFLIAALFFTKANNKEITAAETETTNTDETLKVLDFKVSDIKEITIADSTESLTYIPNGDEWSLQGYDEIPVDYEKLNYNCERLLQVEASRQIEATSLQDFGLDKPTQTVTYTLNDGSKVELLVGIRTPDTANSYVKINTQDSPIYLISSLISNSFVSHINDLRNSQLEEYDSTNVTGLTVKGRDIDTMQISLAQQQNSLMTSYVLTTDTLNQVAVDGNIFEELVQNLPAIEIADFIADDVTDLSPYGLDDPKLHLIIEITETDSTAQKSSTRSLDYIWGNELDNGKIIFMKTGDKSVYAMDNSFLKPLLEGLDPFKLSYKWIALVGIDTVKTVDLHLPSGEYHLGIEQDTYTINNKTVTEDNFKTLYTALIDIKADHLVTNEIISASDTPEIYFIYTLKDGSTKTVNFYKYNDQFLLSTLNETMTVNCSLKQFTYLEELIIKTLSSAK